MSEQKRYTAQEMREAALSCETVEVADQFYSAEMDRAATMLRYAADVVERCEKVIARCNEAKDMNSPTWTFDKQAFAMDLYEIVNCILRREAGKEEK